ncbi:sigma-54 dependent transcriptional regulator [Treponema paraluiscuniculi Cuniculi A]|uniref:Sigma-54 dependent transcriptional regulator n=3 Tax=Treponema paraluiscuniculi TaxID=53435 RepID=F7XRS5_TREPU|nr:sigma-54-dependent Fis family transcriptional regulator [Treponema paraluiscuniculi]AEH40037.1 sigma-54 dependent transcriptional regulator [Treponema paraluiscuniculi Cuniculi A]
MNCSGCPARALSPLPAEKSLEMILDALYEIARYELAVVLSFESSQILRVRKARGPLYTPRLQHHTIDLTKRQDLARILSQKSPYLFDPTLARTDTYTELIPMPQNHSCLIAPLYIDDTPIGMLTLDHRLCEQFTPDVVRFITTLSKLISLAVAQTDASETLSQKSHALLTERNALLAPQSPAFKNMIGTSPAWTRTLDAIKLVAASDLPVLVCGETGTGKELVARTVHQLSTRSDKPFVPVNCSALVHSLAESELFGHEKGAFSGAVGTHRGRFELAHGGTLFLDEVGDLPLELQPKLLRVLQDGVFERVGGERSVSVSVRIIAATNINLSEAVTQGKFREDLLYRLDVFPLSLPPLRERAEDVALLAEHFIQKIKTRPGFERTQLSPSAFKKIFSLTFPGNVRELRNLLERAALLARGDTIGAEHLVCRTPESGTQTTVYPREHTEVSESIQPAIPLCIRDSSCMVRCTQGKKEETTLVVNFHQAQRAAIQAALDASNGKIYGANGAAEILGLKPSTLQSKMKKLGL